jgi:NAD(P)-dependent dehydrogenase (short-subunit alcohol dehydrogenase family)
MGIMEKFSLEGQCSIITGSARGLGKAMAEALAEAGSDIVIADIDWEAANQVAEQIRKKGVRVLPVKNNVTSNIDTDNLVKTVMNNFRKIDVLINNAGIW